MMFNKAVPPAYLTFEDRRLWEHACYYWGDTEIVQGTIGSGTITCNGTSLVYSDYVFAHCTAISSHKLSNGKNFSASAAAQNFTVTVSVNDSSAFSALSDSDIVIEVKQHVNASTTNASLASITKADWTSGAVNNQITVNITSTHKCLYLIVGVLGASGVTASWNIIAVTGSRQPLGITANQCAAVTGVNFNYNSVVRLFDNDSLYFTGLTSVSGRTFMESRFTYVRFPYATTVGNSTSGNYAVFYYARQLRAARLDSAETINAFNFVYATQNYKYTVITTSSVPSLAGTDARLMQKDIYVLDSLVSSYQADTKWANKSILPLSQLPTDYPDCPWLVDLRAKGLIPSN